MTLLRPFLAAALALACAACGGADDSAGYDGRGEAVSSAPATEVAPAAPPGRELALDVDPAVEEARSGGAAQVQPGTRAAPTDSAAVPAMIIRTGTATVEVDSLEPAVARVRQLAQRVGGYVANTSQQGGERAVRQATIELKVPAPRFDEALRGLSPLGEVESVNVTAQDVGEEFTDVTARVANARRLEARLLDLLESRTGRLEDVLAVERELARVREAIERHEGRLRFLRTRVAVSTLTVTLHEPFPVVGDYPGANPVLSAFRQAWRNFVAFVAAFIASLGFLVPLGAILFVAWLAFRRLRGRRGPRRPPHPAEAPRE